MPFYSGLGFACALSSSSNKNKALSSNSEAGLSLRNMNEQNNVGRFDRVARFVSLAVAMAYALSVVLNRDPSEHDFVLMNGIDRDLVETLTSGQNTDSMFKTIVDERGFPNHRAPEPILSQNFETLPRLKTPTSQGNAFSVTCLERAQRDIFLVLRFMM